MESLELPTSKSEHWSDTLQTRNDHTRLNQNIDSTGTGEDSSHAGAGIETNTASTQDQISQLRAQLQEVTAVFTTEIEAVKARIQIQAAPPPRPPAAVRRGGGGVAGIDPYIDDKIRELESVIAMLKVRVAELELQLQASLATTHNGVFLWRIPNVAQRRLEAKAKRICSIYSPPFYTSRSGYKLCIRAYLNGDGVGHESHLSLFIVVMKGEYDALLTWPFKQKVSLILLDHNHRKHIVQTFRPTPGLSSFMRPQSEMNVASGCPQFAPLQVLDDPRYVDEDAMFIKCIVDVQSAFVP